MKTEIGKAICKPKRDLRRNQTCRHRDLQILSQNCEKVNFYCLSHTVSGNWLWKLYHINTVTIGYCSYCFFFEGQTWQLFLVPCQIFLQGELLLLLSECFCRFLSCYRCFKNFLILLSLATSIFYPFTSSHTGVLYDVSILTITPIAYRLFYGLLQDSSFRIYFL